MNELQLIKEVPDRYWNITILLVWVQLSKKAFRC